MAVVLSPPELSFRRPFDREVQQLLELRNVNETPVAFKVKTTAPKHYCVRPNSGRIEAGQVVEVQVLLQSMKEDPAPDAKCRDKFLVQTVAITPDLDVGITTEIWQHVEKTAKQHVQEKKIRVMYLPPEGVAAVTPQRRDVNGLANGDRDSLLAAASPSYGSPTEAVTPTTGLSRGPADPSSERNGTSGDHSDLRSQLEEAQAKIASLNREISAQGLRQRKIEATTKDAQERVTTGSTGMGIQQQVADGVPVQIVAGLCLLSFLLAYFLF